MGGTEREARGLEIGRRGSIRELIGVDRHMRRDPSVGRATGAGEKGVRHSSTEGLARRIILGQGVRPRDLLSQRLAIVPRKSRWISVRGHRLSRTIFRKPDGPAPFVARVPVDQRDFVEGAGLERLGIGRRQNGTVNVCLVCHIGRLFGEDLLHRQRAQAGGGLVRAADSGNADGGCAEDSHP